ncbi:MAG TPA: hypothetical protein VK666_12555, partial [Chryseolinea sp.]|nr:hypothetical protein [Chryseolinea sp.]
MKRVGRVLVSWVLFILSVSACVEPYFPTIKLPDNGVLVVDGFLVSNDSTKIKLSRAQGFDSLAISSRETNARVEILGAKGDSYVL